MSGRQIDEVLSRLSGVNLQILDVALAAGLRPGAKSVGASAGKSESRRVRRSELKKK